MLILKDFFKSIIDEVFKQKINDLMWIGIDLLWDNVVKFLIENVVV